MAGGVSSLKGEHSSLFHAKQEVVRRMAYSHCRRYAFSRKPQYLLLKGNTGVLPFSFLSLAEAIRPCSCLAEMSIGHNLPLSGQAYHPLSNHFRMLLPAGNQVKTL